MYVFGFVCLVLSALGGAVTVYNTVDKNLKLYKAEGVCIGEYVKSGTPRKDIVASDGTCSVIPSP